MNVECTMRLFLFTFVHFQVHRYNEDFLPALEGFSKAAALDPTWDEPKQKEQQILAYLCAMRELQQSKVI